MEVKPQDLREQYARAVHLWPFIHDVEAAHSLPRFLLFAIGSRETGFNPEYAQGKVHNDGHGWGLFGADDRWNKLDLPAFASDPRAQAERTATILEGNRRGFGNWLDAVNAYGPASGRPAYGIDVLERAAFLLDQTRSRPAMKFVTRTQAGLRPADTSTNITPVGVAVHWEGPDIGEPGPAIWDHGLCAGIVRGFQAYHMDTNGWADIAYSAVVCPHGYVFEGRGPGHRTAANGSNDGNQRFYAVCYMGGEGDAFTDEARDGINDAIDWLGGGVVNGHRDHTSTACPGDEIYAWVRAGHPRSGTPDAPQPPEEDQLFSPAPVRTVHLMAAHSGLLLTSSAAEHQAGVVQRKADGSLNQRWEVWGHEDGTVTFLNRAGGLALDRPDYSTEPGTLLQVANNEFNDAQRWTIDETEPRVARIWAPGTNSCLDVRMRSQEEGAALQLWVALMDEDDPRHQRFFIAESI